MSSSLTRENKRNSVEVRVKDALKEDVGKGFIRIDADIVNVNGGAVALGHPIGASGSRIVVTLLHEMIKRRVKYGLASLCIGSGEGMAIILKRL